jgi:predicted nuclease of predicted toxin-antitoxin system
MKLLLDENLSRRIVPFLQDPYPGSTQVALVGLERADDRTIWNYAKDNGYVIVSRDADFEELSMFLGQPPQVIWLRVSNQSKAAILNLLVANQDAITSALQDEHLACIELA